MGDAPNQQNAAAASGWQANTMTQQHQQGMRPSFRPQGGVGMPQQQQQPLQMTPQQQMQFAQMQQMQMIAMQQQSMMAAAAAAGRGVGIPFMRPPNMFMNPFMMQQQQQQQQQRPVGGVGGMQMGGVGVGVGRGAASMARPPPPHTGGGGSGSSWVGGNIPPPPPPPPSQQQQQWGRGGGGGWSMQHQTGGVGAPASPSRRDQRADILEMTYEEYLDAFNKLKDKAEGGNNNNRDADDGGDGDGGDGQQQAAQGAGESGHQQQTPQLMDEEQYVDHCRKHLAQMGMPFDETQVRSHYHTMKAAFQASQGGG